MKIAILAIGGVDRSGTDRVIPCLLWLIEHLARAGQDVHVFVPTQEPTAATWPLLGATIHNAGAGPWRLRTLRSIAREHRKSAFDIVHAFWSSMGFVAALAGMALKAPMVLTLPGGDLVSFPEIGYGGLLSWRGRAELRVAARAARRTTVPSQYMRDLAKRQEIETVIVPLGVDLRQWPPSPPRPRDASRPIRLVHVANLNRVKDQPALLRAACLLKAQELAFEVRIIGFDTMGGEMQRLAKRLGMEDEISFVGMVADRGGLRRHYEWADLLVMTSLHEAGPVVMLEAALAGVPTVGTRVGHMADQAPEAVAAVPARDPAALAEAIRALATDEACRLRIAKAAQSFAIEHDAARTTTMFTEIYRDAALRH